MPYVVYKLTNKVTGKSYIGKTRDLPARIRKHKVDTHCVYLHNSIVKHGIDNFEVEILAENLTEPEAFRLEEKFILEFKTLKPFGYNLLEKDGIERRLSKESLEKLAKSLQGRSDLVKIKSKFIGVRRRRGTRLIEVRIRYGGTRYQRYFSDEITAAEAYDKMAVYFYGIGAKVNFIDNMEQYVNSDLKAFSKSFNKCSQNENSVRKYGCRPTVGGSCRKQS